MADGDIVYNSIPRKYGKFFHEVVEGIWSSEDLGKEALKPIRKDVLYYGDMPIDLIYRFYNDALSYIDKEPLFRELTQWSDVIKHLEKLRISINGPKRGLDLAEQAIKEEVHKMEKAGEFPSDVLERLFESYLYKIYRTNFEDRIPLISYEDPSYDPTYTIQRLQEIQPYLNKNLHDIAVQLARGKKVRTLIIPKLKQNSSKPNLETDIFDLFVSKSSK